MRKSRREIRICLGKYTYLCSSSSPLSLVIYLILIHHQIEKNREQQRLGEC